MINLNYVTLCDYTNLQMIKKFFISMLGTIAGFWISLFIAVFVGVAVIGAVISSGAGSSPQVDKNSILYLDLSGTMPERYQPADFWQMVQGAGDNSEALVDILDALRIARNDSKIKGLYINAAGAAAGFASREEIAEAIREFKTSGKWVYAYADAYTQGDYMLASLADSVFLNPVGGVDVRGVASQIPFFKGLLDKLGVKMDVVRVGTFKSAVEPYITDAMSPASRMQTQVMVDSLWQFYAGVVSDARGVEQAQVDMWADSIMGVWGAQRTLDAGAVSALRYRHAVEDLLRDECGMDKADELKFVTPSAYLASKDKKDSGKGHIAVLFANGDIVDSGEGGIVGETMVPEIYKLADNDNVKALVLRVNSGGGSAFASEQIWEALEYFKSKDKKFYVSMGDYAASGGYYISCGADRIFADHCTLTGSIGVFGIIPDFSGLVTDKLGVTFSTVQSSANATFPSVLTGMTAYQRDALQKSVERTYDTFTMRVAEGRHMSQDSVKAIAEGRVWTGGAALALGLVDEIGSLSATVEAIADAAGIDADKVVYYPVVEDKMLAELLAGMRGNIKAGGLDINASAMRVLQMLDRMQTDAPVQARMPMMYFE